MKRRTIVVTGGTGFLGSEIVKQLVDADIYSVVAVDITPPDLGRSTFPSVRYERANVLDPEQLDRVFQEVKPSIVVHTVGIFDADAARYDHRNRNTIFEVNVQGTKNVVEAARKCGASGLVYTASITVLTDEVNAEFRNADETWPTGRAELPYGQSKVRHLLHVKPCCHRCSTTSM
jgi:sterol-4alpha-carboxylate 3-dehydrogenase (decarboxylating)